MPKFIPREKMDKKARKQSDKERRATWAFSPVTRRPDSSKAYNRRKAQVTAGKHRTGRKNPVLFYLIRFL